MIDETLIIDVAKYFTCTAEMARILILSAINNKTLTELEKTVTPPK